MRATKSFAQFYNWITRKVAEKRTTNKVIKQQKTTLKWYFVCNVLFCIDYFMGCYYIHGFFSSFNLYNPTSLLLFYYNDFNGLNVCVCLWFCCLIVVKFYVIECLILCLIFVIRWHKFQMVLFIVKRRKYQHKRSNESWRYTRHHISSLHMKFFIFFFFCFFKFTAILYLIYLSFY